MVVTLNSDDSNTRCVYDVIDENPSNNQFVDDEDMMAHYHSCKLGTKLRDYMTNNPENVVGETRFQKFLNTFNDKVAPMIVAGLLHLNIWALMQTYIYHLPEDNDDHESPISIEDILNCPWHDWTEEEIVNGINAFAQEEHMDIREEMTSTISLTDEMIEELRSLGLPIDAMMEEAKNHGGAREWHLQGRRSATTSG